MASTRSLTIVLTLDCNLRCQYCCVEKLRHHSADWPRLRHSLDPFLRDAADDLDIAFTGGEPLLQFDTLRRVVSYVERTRTNGRRTRWTILTNGLLLDDRTIAFLQSHRFAVALSCDGVPGAQALRGRGTFHRLDALLDNLRRRYPELFEQRLRVNMTVSPASVAHLAESVEYLLDKRVPTVTLSAAMGPMAWDPSGMDELERQFERLSRAVRAHYERTGQVPLGLFRKRRGERRPRRLRKWTCAAPEGRSVTIDVDGQLYGCLLASSSYHPWSASATHVGAEALKIGNPDEEGATQGLRAMTDAARACGVFQHLDQRFSSYGHCADCRFLGRCQICPLAIAPEGHHGGERRVPDFLCAFSRAALAARDRFPSQLSLRARLTDPL